MKQGSRKFLGFVLTLLAYTFVLFIALTKVTNLAVDISLFAVQGAIGYGTIASLFFASNVLEHFTDKGKIQPVPGPSNKNDEVKQ
jgi:hypothetical protein